MIEMLASLGIKAVTDERRGINIDGLKISGSAQSIHKDRVLFHATLLFSSDLQRLLTSLDSPPEQNRIASKRKVTVKSVKSPVTNISDYLPHSTGMEEIRKYIVNYYRKEKTENRIYTLTKEDVSGIEELKNIKYATNDWIYDGKFLKK